MTIGPSSTINHLRSWSQTFRYVSLRKIKVESGGWWERCEKHIVARAVLIMEERDHGGRVGTKSLFKKYISWVLHRYKLAINIFGCQCLQIHITKSIFIWRKYKNSCNIYRSLSYSYIYLHISHNVRLKKLWVNYFI